MAPILDAVATFAIDKIPVDREIVFHRGTCDMLGHLDVSLAFPAPEDALAMDGPDLLHVPLCAAVGVRFFNHAQLHTAVYSLLAYKCIQLYATIYYTGLYISVCKNIRLKTWLQ